MAAKKVRRKTKSNKRRTPAQRAATKRLIALNKSKGRKKRKTKKRKAKRRGHSVAHHMSSANRRGFQPHSSGVASHYHSGSRSYAAGVAAHKPKRRKGKRRRKTHKHYTGVARSIKRHKKAGGMVTAASILRGARTRKNVVWLCGGKKYTGCGGGKKGGHVVGHLR